MNRRHFNNCDLKRMGSTDIECVRILFMPDNTLFHARLGELGWRGAQRAEALRMDLVCGGSIRHLRLLNLHATGTNAGSCDNAGACDNAGHMMTRGVDNARRGFLA